MRTCKRCDQQKLPSDFYANDKTCKECRKAMVRANYRKNIGHYKTYDRRRSNLQHRVDARKEYARTDGGLAAGSRAKKRYIERNPIKRAAHVMVGNAIRDGILTRGACEVCGTDQDIHGHHDDYALPLVVRWLCSKHHAEWHNDNEPLFGGKPMESAA